MSKGLQSMPRNRFMIPSPYLNVYSIPEELDYTDLRPLSSNWYRIDCFQTFEEVTGFQIPDKLRDKSGKLIYLSLGPMFSVDVPLMKRLVSILSKSKHRFMVSKGLLHDQYELADNMWGQEYVPQLQVLPIVDLVITHGGNNTIN